MCLSVVCQLWIIICCSPKASAYRPCNPSIRLLNTMISKRNLCLMLVIAASRILVSDAFSSSVSSPQYWTPRSKRHGSTRRSTDCPAESTPVLKVLRRKAATMKTRVQFDTSKSARISVMPEENTSLLLLQYSIGFVGHSGLILASTVLVMLARAFLQTVQQSQGQGSEVEGGMMDRCPWPFIFTHDPIQGLKDPPTWIVVTWLVLWRIVKRRNGKLL